MVNYIEGVDCTLPAFAHSSVFRLRISDTKDEIQPVITGKYIWFFANTAGNLLAFVKAVEEVAKTSWTDSNSLHALLQSDKSLAKCVVPKFSSNGSPYVLCDNGVSSIALCSGNEILRLDVQVKSDEHHSSHMHIEARPVVTLPEQIVCGAYLVKHSSKLVAVTSLGKGYLLNASVSAESPPLACLFDVKHRPSCICAVEGNAVLIHDKESGKILIVDVSTGIVSELSVKGEVPTEVSEAVDFSICGMVWMGKVGRLGIMATTEGGQNCLIAIVSLEKGATSPTAFSSYQYEAISFNDLFLQETVSTNSDSSHGYFKWVPEIAVLLASHSSADSVVVLKHSSKDDSWTCLLLPDGKQLSSSPVGGATADCLLRGLGVSFLDHPLELSQSDGSTRPSRLAVFTLQQNNYLTAHLGVLPDNWKIEKEVVAVVAKVASTKTATSSVSISAPPPPLFNPKIKPPSNNLIKEIPVSSNAAAPLPPMFNPKIKPPETSASNSAGAPMPPIFNPKVKPPASLLTNVEQFVSLEKKATDITQGELSSKEALDPSLIEMFEKELRLWEALGKGSVPEFREETLKVIDDDTSAAKDRVNVVIEAGTRCEQNIKSINDSLSMSLFNSSELQRLYEKLNTINDKVQKAAALLAETHPIVQNATTIRKTPSVTPTKTKTPPTIGFAHPDYDTMYSLSESPVAHPISLFRPLPPAMRKVNPGGIGLITPIKPTGDRSRRTTPTLTELLSEKPPRGASLGGTSAGGFRNVTPKKDVYVSRLMQGSPAASGYKSSNRVSLGELLAGKVLSSEPESLRDSPQPTSGHGATWQLLRKIEEQKQMAEKLLRQVHNVSATIR